MPPASPRPYKLDRGPIRDVEFKDINASNLCEYYLKGLSDLFIDQRGTPWGDKWFNWCLAQGMMKIEEFCSISIQPVPRIESHDYTADDVSNYVFIDVWRPPVHEVISLSAVWPATLTAGGVPPWAQGRSVVEFDDLDQDSVAFEFPKEWIRVREGGHIQLLPTVGATNLTFLGSGSVYLPLLYGHLHYLPHLWRVEYISGFYNSRIPFIVVDSLYKAAAIEALTKLGETLRPPGVTNIELDLEGLTRRYQFDAGKRDGMSAMFGDIISRYERDLYGSADHKSLNHLGGALQQIKDKYHGVAMWSM